MTRTQSKHHDHISIIPTVTMAMNPLPIVLDTRRQRWETGTQAIFAGFVAVAHLQRVSPLTT